MEWAFRQVRQVSASGWGFPHAFTIAFMHTTSAGVTWQKLSSSAMLQPAAPVAPQFFEMHCLHASGSSLVLAQAAVCARRHLSGTGGAGAGAGWQYSCSQLRVQFALRMSDACFRTHASHVDGSGWDGAGCRRLQLRSSSSMHATSSGVTLQKRSLHTITVVHGSQLLLSGARLVTGGKGAWNWWPAAHSPPKVQSDPVWFQFLEMQRMQTSGSSRVVPQSLNRTARHFSAGDCATTAVAHAAAKTTTRSMIFSGVSPQGIPPTSLCAPRTSPDQLARVHSTVYYYV